MNTPEYKALYAAVNPQPPSQVVYKGDINTLNLKRSEAAQLMQQGKITQEKYNQMMNDIMIEQNLGMEVLPPLKLNNSLCPFKCCRLKVKNSISPARFLEVFPTYCDLPL